VVVAFVTGVRMASAGTALANGSLLTAISSTSRSLSSLKQTCVPQFISCVLVV
jgi:hypothetical protein